MVEGSIPRRYAKALLELASEAGRLDAVLAEIEAFAHLAGPSGEPVTATLSNPLFTHVERRAVLDQLVVAQGISTLVANFLRLLVDKGRLGVLPEIVREYRALADKVSNRIRATVTTAFALDAYTEAEVQQALSRVTGKTVLIDKIVDPTLLGGVVARVGSVVYDASLRSRLDRLQLSLSAPIRA